MYRTIAFVIKINASENRMLVQGEQKYCSLVLGILKVNSEIIIIRLLKYTQNKTSNYGLE